MSAPTCSTCKHWIRIDVDHPTEETVYTPRWLDKMKPTQWGYCGAVAEVEPETDMKFFVHDASEYLAKLGTREDFGCSEHATPAWICEECRATWEVTPMRPGQCHLCGNRTRVKAPDEQGDAILGAIVFVAGMIFIILLLWVVGAK